MFGYATGQIMQLRGTYTQESWLKRVESNCYESKNGWEGMKKALTQENWGYKPSGLDSRLTFAVRQANRTCSLQNLTTSFLIQI